MNVIAILLAAGALGASAGAPGTAAFATQVPHGPIPPAEAAFCATLDDFAARDRAAGMNEIKLAALRGQRASALASSAPEGTFTGWVGTIVDLHRTFQGRDILRVKLPCRGEVATWSSFVPDLFDKTQIPSDSSLFETLSHLRPGTPVVVSGSFVASREDGFRDARTSEKESMSDPEFIVHFRSVAAASR